MTYKDIIKTTEFKHFINSIRGFCEFIESDEKSRNLVNLQRLLLDIYKIGLNLNQISILK